MSVRISSLKASDYDLHPVRILRHERVVKHVEVGRIRGWGRSRPVQ